MSVFDYVCFKIMKRKVGVIRQNVLCTTWIKPENIGQKIKKQKHTHKQIKHREAIILCLPNNELLLEWRILFIMNPIAQVIKINV